MMYSNDYIERTVGYYAGKDLLLTTWLDEVAIEQVLRVLVDCGVPPQLLKAKVYDVARISETFNAAPELCARAVGEYCVGTN